MNKTKLGCGCMSVVFGVIVIVVVLASAYLLNFALKPEHNKGLDYKQQYAAIKNKYPWIRQWIDSLQGAKAIRDTFIMVPGGETRFLADDSTRLHALIINAPRKTKKTAVLVPGYTDCAVDMLHVGYIYNRLLSMNLVIPDLHANGKSDGKAMQMGWKDRFDVLRWINVADSLYKDSTGHAAIVVHGQSMGAATTMNVSGEITDNRSQITNLKSSVKCFVEDCGYTSAWDEFSYELNDMFGLPDIPLLYTASALCKLKYGWSFGEASSLKQVAKSHKPMLFIHGNKDTFVPIRMVWPLYKAKPAPKKIVIFNGSKHAASYHDHPQEYEAVIKSFVERYISE